MTASRRLVRRLEFRLPAEKCTRRSSTSSRICLYPARRTGQILSTVSRESMGPLVARQNLLPAKVRCARQDDGGKSAPGHGRHGT